MHRQRRLRKPLPKLGMNSQALSTTSSSPQFSRLRQGNADCSELNFVSLQIPGKAAKTDLGRELASAMQDRIELDAQLAELQIEFYRVTAENRALKEGELLVGRLERKLERVELRNTALRKGLCGEGVLQAIAQCKAELFWLCRRD